MLKKDVIKKAALIAATVTADTLPASADIDAATAETASFYVRAFLHVAAERPIDIPSMHVWSESSGYDFDEEIIWALEARREELRKTIDAYVIGVKHKDGSFTAYGMHSLPKTADYYKHDRGDAGYPNIKLRPTAKTIAWLQENAHFAEEITPEMIRTIWNYQNSVDGYGMSMAQCFEAAVCCYVFGKSLHDACDHAAHDRTDARVRPDLTAHVKSYDYLMRHFDKVIGIEIKVITGRLLEVSAK